MRCYQLTGISIIAMSALLAGLEACSDTPPGPEVDPGTDFGVTDLALGQEVTGCSTNVTGALVGTVLTISNFNSAANNYVHAVVISAPSGSLKMNGVTCVNAAGQSLLVGTGASGTGRVVNKIVVTAAKDASNDKVLLDLYGSNFDNVLVSGNGIDVDLGTGNATDTGVDSFMVRGTSSADTVKVVRAGTSPTFYDYVNIMSNGTDVVADVRVIRSEVIGASLGAGNDVQAAPATLSTAWRFAGTTLTGISATQTRLLVYGGDGDDSLGDGNAADTIYGGNGADTIVAFATKDAVQYGNNGDLFYGDDGATNLATGDTIDYRARSNALTAQLDGTAVSGEANERDLIGADFEIVYGGSGNDTITGSAGADAATANIAETLYGGNGNDLITGGEGYDTVYGGNGNDVISGSNGADFLYGENGDDTFKALSTVDGDDTLSGGNGTDKADYSLRTLAITATINSTGGDTASGEADVLGQSNDVEQLQGSNDADVMTGSGFGDTIWGGNGADTIDGMAGNDYLYGGGDNDNITGNAGDDVIFGEGGDDTLEGSDDNDAISCGSGADTASGSNGSDYIFGEDDADSLSGGDGPDVLYAGNGADTMVGGTVNEGDTCFLGADSNASDSTFCDNIPY